MPSATEIPLPGCQPLPPATQQKLPALVPRKRKTTPQNAVPVPDTPTLPSPPNLAEICFMKPRRAILSPHDLELFETSKTHDLILAFVFSIAEACTGKQISSVGRESQPESVLAVLSILATVSDLVDANPPADQGSSRFGNPAFKSFVDGVTQQLPGFHASLALPRADAAEELSVYLEHAFGSRERIDYGSGHELNFAMWLLCLNRLSLLPPPTFAAVGLLVFPAYIRLMRKIQSAYYLEPAGSHGVWGLDDYQFLPFLFGAAQLVHHPYVTPRAIHNDLVLEEESPEYAYLDMVRFTISTKTVKGLRWTQPMLDDISGAKNWEKVEQGMRRMFCKEILGKLPIMQHFLFGSLIPAPDGVGSSDDENVQEEKSHQPGPDHVHREDEWGDCCGIKLPSAVAAGQEARKREGLQGLRRVPFD